MRGRRCVRERTHLVVDAALELLVGDVVEPVLDARRLVVLLRVGHSLEVQLDEAVDVLLAVVGAASRLEERAHLVALEAQADLDDGGDEVARKDVLVVEAHRGGEEGVRGRNERRRVERVVEDREEDAELGLVGDEVHVEQVAVLLPARRVRRRGRCRERRVSRRRPSQNGRKEDAHARLADAARWKTNVSLE